MVDYTFQPYSGLTPNQVKQRYGYGSNLLKQGSDISPVGHWTQAIARGLQGAAGGYVSNYAGDQEKEGQGAVAKVYQALMSGQATPQQASAALMNTGGWGTEQGQQLANAVIKQRMAQSDPMLDLKRRQIEASMDAEKRRLSIAEGQAARQNRLTDAQLAQLKMASPDERAAIAQRYGMKPGTPAYQQFVLQGSLPSKTGPDSTAMRYIYQAQDELPNVQASVEQLEEARGLLNRMYHGLGSQTRSTLNQALPGPNVFSDPTRAQNTQRFYQIMNERAVGAMSEALKGATTDKEMAEFKTIIADPNTSPSTKRRAIETMLQRARRQLQLKRMRIQELGGNLPPEPSAQPAGQASPGAGWSAQRVK